MVEASHGFKRVVLGLQPHTPHGMMRLAVELAGLLELDLLGLFLEEVSLRDLASIPFAREFRPLGGGWRPFDLDHLSHDMEVAARSTERMFAEAAKRLAARSRFAVVRGSTAETIASISRAGDIIMVVEPVSPAERATQQFSWLIEAAFHSAGAVMIAPSRITRTRGPVVAIAAARNDPCIDSAAAIAIAAGEELVVVAAYDGATDNLPIRKLTAGSGLTIKHVAAGKITRSDPLHVFRALNQFNERLIVMTRDVLTNDMALRIASVRAVPLLVIEPIEVREGVAAPRHEAD